MNTLKKFFKDFLLTFSYFFLTALIIAGVIKGIELALSRWWYLGVLLLIIVLSFMFALITTFVDKHWNK